MTILSLISFLGGKPKRSKMYLCSSLLPHKAGKIQPEVHSLDMYATSRDYFVTRDFFMLPIILGYFPQNFTQNY